MSDQTIERNEEDVMVILVATDIHLGYLENDPIRGQDTFNTLEEVLKIAHAEEVDLILLGGDLFHLAKPSPYCIHKCTELIRKYCLGDRPVAVEFLSDPHTTLTGSFNETVNYEDPNLNVSIPVFSIHGNHDDPTGQRHISAMDLLASSGLVNYFGKCKNYDEVDIQPILLRKGHTKLALYGLSHIKDERLGRLFLNKKVKMSPPEDTNNWFHLLVWHQNRAARGLKNFIPDDVLPAFLDLVIWGHEHDCRITPERKRNDVFVSQPGSTVATSLSEGESLPKHVGILKIHKNDFNMMPVELKTVRPFIYDEITIKSTEMDGLGNVSNSATEHALNKAKEKIEEMIQKAKDLGHYELVTRHPLIRLKVNCTKESQIFNTIRLGQMYSGKVANPDDMIKCQLLRDKIKRVGANNQQLDEIELERESVSRVEDMVTDYFREHDVLKCFPVGPINETTRRFVDFDDTDSYHTVIAHMRKQCLSYLEAKMPEGSEVTECIKQFKIETEDELQRSVINLLEKRGSVSRNTTASASNPSTTGRGGSRAKGKTTKAAQRSTYVDLLSDEDEDVADAVANPQTRPGTMGRRGRSKARGATTASTVSSSRKRNTAVRNSSPDPVQIEDSSNESDGIQYSEDDMMMMTKKVVGRRPNGRGSKT